MTDARRIDLNYGHFGEPIYDAESRDWRFTRNTRTLISSQPSSPTTAITQPSVRRAQTIGKLVRHFPELAPCSGFLPSSVEPIRVDRESFADHNQTLSERVAFGRAIHPCHHRNNPRTVPVVAFVGGAAGELVRVVQLTPETLGLDGATTTEFQGEIFQSRVQGLWYTSRGPVQQLQFANLLHEPTEWLAVRHGGATSILRITLRESEVPTLHRIPHVPLLAADVELRIELEHVMVLPVQSSGDAFHTDVCFNPWQPSEIAVLDQSSRWKVWNIKSINKHTKVWTSEAGSSGCLTEDAPEDANDSSGGNETKNYDDWGALRFVCEGNYLFVCNRKRIACFDLRGRPASFKSPELELKKSADWILDVRHVSTQPEYIFITTSSRIFWIHLALEDFENTERPRLGAHILLAWRHFRSREDVALSTQIVSLPPNIMVLLYSRLTGLKTLFTLHQARHFPSSDFSPYPIQLCSHDDSLASRCSTVVLQVLRQDVFSQPAGNGGVSSCQENGIQLIRSLILNSDSTLRQLYLVSCIPELLPYMFIISNGLLDDDAQAWPLQAISSGVQDSAQTSTVKHRDLSIQKDQWTINFEWLGECITPSLVPLLDECLQLVLRRLEADKGTSSQRLVSLEELIGQEVTIGDVDQSSTALADFFSGVENRQADDEADSLIVSRLTSPSLSPTMHNLLGISLSQAYQSLEELWMTSSTATVPPRANAAIGRSIRLVATQLHLAGNGMCRLQSENQPEAQGTQTDDLSALRLTLPLRQAGSRSDKAQKWLPEQVSGSERDFEEEKWMPAASLPTPEPTPSLRSQGSRSSVGSSEESEDTARRTSSPRGRVAMGILSQWSLGQEPDDQFWEAGHRGIGPDDVPREMAGTRGKRKRRERVGKPRGQDTDASGPSSPLMPRRLGASQGSMGTDGLNSSQARSLLTSQFPQPGRHGWARRSKKAKKAGFR
ncbi:MAG: hypothetical protein Q9168_000652 [Polycauliona sp. 1 TL-2023]